MEYIEQRPTPPNEWLYKDEGENRLFAKQISYRKDYGQPWLECLDIEKVTWNMDFSKDIDLSGYNPTDKGTTFLQNFKEHIALRLTANGSGKTLTLSQAVRDAIHAAEATYGIEAIIVTQKGWRIQPDAS